MKIYLYVGRSRYSAHTFNSMNEAVEIAEYLISKGIKASLVLNGIPVILSDMCV